MESATSGVLIGRDEPLARIQQLHRRLRAGGTDWVWVAGDTGCGRSLFLETCAQRASRTGWEVLQGQCTEETLTDPYGPFLSMLGLCLDKSGRLINDRSVHSIVDQISLDDVFGAITDLPGMAVVALGIKVGMSIFETRRRPRAQDDLLNRNFEFILQILRQAERKRQKPIFVIIDDLQLASTTTCALLEYICTRIQDTRLCVAATWQAGSEPEALKRIRGAVPRLAQAERVLYLPPLSGEHTQMVLQRLCTRPVSDRLASTLVKFSQGLPGRLAESLRLVELEGDTTLHETSGPDAADSLVENLVARQVTQMPARERALLACMSLIGQRVPLDVLSAPSLCAYLGMGERELLSMAIDLADRGVLLGWDGEQSVRFASSSVYRFLRGRARLPLRRRDHVRIAEAWQAARGDAHPAQLATHYLAGGQTELAVPFAIRSAEDLMRSAAYPEAVQGYRLALEALDQLPEPDVSLRHDVLRAMSLAAEQAGDWDEALSRLEEALALCRGDTEREAEIYAGAGWLHFQRGEVQAALEALDHSTASYTVLGNVQGLAQVDYYRGMVFGRQKEWQRAVACFERYLNVSQASGFDEGRASAYVELGNLHRLQRNWAEAETVLQQGIELAQAGGDHVVLAQGYNYLGRCYALQGRPESIDMLQRALDIVHTRTKQPAQEARIQNTMAETLVRMNRWTKAEEAFRASAAIKERLGDRAGLAMTYGGLGRLYLRQWRFDQAIAYLEKDIALLAAEYDANLAWIQQWTNLIGEAHRLQGQHDRAAQRFAEAMSLADRIPDRIVREQSTAFTHLLLARLALDRGDVSAAGRECEAALDVLVGTWADEEVQRTAARLACAQGDLEQARRHLDRAQSAANREDLDRGLTGLQEAHFYRESGDVERAREWAGRVVGIARQLQNAELERRASRLLDHLESMNHGRQV